MNRTLLALVDYASEEGGCECIFITNKPVSYLKVKVKILPIMYFISNSFMRLSKRVL